MKKNILLSRKLSTTLCMLGFSLVSFSQVDIITQTFSPVELTYQNDVSNSDLLVDITPTISGAPWNTGVLSLTDGVHGGSGTSSGVQGTWADPGAIAEYDLGTGTNGTGYDLTSIVSIAAWDSAGYGKQGWTIEVQPVGGVYATLYTVLYEPIIGLGATKVVLESSSGILTTGIEKIKITTNSLPTHLGRFVWRELDIFGVSNNTVTWEGSASSDWATATNWDTGVAPTASDTAIISDVTNQPTATAPVTVNSVVINSGASLIAESTFTGTVTYNRTLGTNNWYLVGSPVVGEAIENLISNHTFASGTGPNIGIAPYRNDGTAWDYQALTSTSPLTPGGGYSVKLANAGDISFTGTMPVDDAGVGVAITVGTANAFNLIGNPYPSYIPVNTNADATNNILTINDTDNNFLTESTIWLWNQATSSYDIINQGSPSMFISPAQGFFVSSNGSHTFSFTEAMQSHQSTDSFQRTENNRPEINLVMTNGSSTRDADIFYINGMTAGFDNGYDSSIFGGVANQFAIYTHAVANATGKKLGIQSLPDTDFENMIIPVGINAVTGTEITISANSVNIPAGLNIYLEDSEDETLTLLDHASEFTTTLSNNLNGIGRFYLHTAASVLDIGDYNLDHISVYKTDLTNLRIVGVQNDIASLKLYNMLGKQILETSFKGNGTNTISLPNLQNGVYIVTIETESGILNKKIVL